MQDDGGTANGGVDLDATANTMTVNVTAVNDAPAGTNKTVTTLEDTPYTFTAADFGFTDPTDSPAECAAAVKITTLPGAGTLTLTGVAVTAGQFVSRRRHQLPATLKFTPAANANGAGYASFTFQVQDDGGTANGGVDLDRVGEHDDGQRDLGQRRAGGHQQDRHHARRHGLHVHRGRLRLHRSRPTAPANALTAVKITTLPAPARLTLSGVAVTAGQFVSVADINAGKLKFTPAANANGAGYAALHLPGAGRRRHRQRRRRPRRRANTMTVNVTAVNDAPAAPNKTVTTLEDTAYTFTAADFGFTDPTTTAPAQRADRGQDHHAARRGHAAARPASHVTAGQFVSLADINAGKLDVHAGGERQRRGLRQLHLPGAGRRRHRQRRRRSRSTAQHDDGQRDRRSTMRRPAPNNTVTTLEDTAYTFTTADFGFTDPSDSAGQCADRVKITTCRRRHAAALTASP